MADVLASQFSGHWISRAELGSLSALKTYDPPITALADATLLGTGRQGKFLILHLADADGIPLDLVIHLSRAGWMHWRTSKALAPLRPGKGPVALRLTGVTRPATPQCWMSPRPVPRNDWPSTWCVTSPTCRVCNDWPGCVGSHRGAAVRDPAWCGPATAEDAAARAVHHLRHRQRLQRRNPARGQTVAICPGRHSYRTTGEGSGTALRDVLQDALERARDAKLGHIKSEKRAGLRVHDRTGEPCDVWHAHRPGAPGGQLLPVLSDVPDRGKPLADRRMSRLLKWSGLADVVGADQVLTDAGCAGLRNRLDRAFPRIL